MTNFETQVKQIECNILLQERKIENLETEIRQLNLTSAETYDRLLKQEEILFNNKMKNIQWDIEINFLKKEKVKVLKGIEKTNEAVQSHIEEFKNKKMETKEHKRKLEKLADLIKKDDFQKKNDKEKYDNSSNNSKNNAISTMLLQFLERKKEHNDNLKEILTKKKMKIKKLEEKYKEIKSNISSTCQKILILDEEMYYNLNRIKQSMLQQINKYVPTKDHSFTKEHEQEKVDNKNDPFSNLLNILLDIIQKHKLSSQSFYDKCCYRGFLQKKSIEPFSDDSNNISSATETNLKLGMHTQEFLEL